MSYREENKSKKNKKEEEIPADLLKEFSFLNSESAVIIFDENN